MSIIKARGVKKEVFNLEQTITILKCVDLTVNQGESLAIMGASGSGKTTLLSLLAGLDVPTEGEIFLDNQAITSLTEDQRAQCRLQKVGFIFQNFDLLPHFNAIENVALPLELCNVKQSQERAIELLEQVGLKHRLHHFPAQLSGGEQQRVAIARAFSTQPKIIFADEPTGNLDSETAQVIIELLFDLNKKSRTTLIMVTHDAQLSSLCERIVYLKDGQLICQQVV